MDVFVIDAEAAMDLARRDFAVAENREIFAPTLLRSQVLALCLAEMRTHRMETGGVLELAERACRLPRRLLGDAVLRRNAFILAARHGWPDTFDAEYIALTELHGVALVAGSPTLREKAEPIIRIETVETFIRA